MDPLFSTYRYLIYWLDEVNEHSLHSPFLFDLYKNAIIKHSDPFPEVESLRLALTKDNSTITYKDPGADKKLKVRKVAEIAKTSLSTRKYSQLYFRLINYLKPNEVIELGTSLGINTCYLAKGGAPVNTFEGVPALSALSNKIFQQLNLNVNLIEGDIDNTLPVFIKNRKKVDFIFFDANHTYDATMSYFHLCLEKIHNETIFIFDDIYWSKGMYSAWQDIKSHNSVRVSLDLYKCGIVFFNKSLSVQHLALKF